MPAKVCPRCDNLYEDLKSKTCPNCFAILEPIDRETAQAIAHARADVEQSPEWQTIKAAEDEKWRQQSFGACLGVVGIFVATTIFAIVMITVAAYRQHHHPSTAMARSVTPLPNGQAGLSPIPAANAAWEEVTPARVGPYERTLREDVPMAGLNVSAFHAAYAFHGDPLRTVDVFAIPANRTPAEQDVFLNAVTIAARLQKQAQPPLPVLTRHWRYALLGPAAPDFAAALAEQFRGG